MQHLQHYFDYLAAFDPAAHHTVDRCHNLFMVGALLSKKPRHVLELGIGAGDLTVSILYALRYNGVGDLTSVDDWSSWGGAEPEGIDTIRAGGANIVAPVNVSDFLEQCGDCAFDLMVVDVCRLGREGVLDELYRVAAEGAFVFFRGANRKSAGGAEAGIEAWLERKGMLWYHFTESTRADEHCNKGWLFSILREAPVGRRRQRPGAVIETNTLEPVLNLAETSSSAARRQTARQTLYLGLIPGNNYGWGVCSRYLIHELSGTVRCHVLNADDGSDRDPALSGPLFQALTGVDFFPMFEKARGRRNYGYTFFENELTAASLENAKTYDLVLAGSSWCRDRMQEKGITNCEVLIQGIDPEIFHPICEAKSQDDFVIFSGGKFELRKGQDLVLKAVKILQQKYDDIVLVNCWYNIWPESMKLMAYSRHIRFEHRNLPWKELMQRVYADNGLDADRIETLELVPNEMQRELYRRTDIGVFPNRCEGGTNLVLMEYMACGKPVIASNTSGHTDIVSTENALLLNELSAYNIAGPDNLLIARWQEPSVDELVAQIEYAYHHRSEIQELGRRAAQDMKRFTWEHTARNLLRHLFPD